MENGNTRHAPHLVRVPWLCHPVRVFWLALALFATAPLLYAQASEDRFDSEWKLFHIQGSEIILNSQGRQILLSPENIPSTGLTLQRGDTLFTGAGNFAEIQQLPQGTVVKVAGNTSLGFQSFEPPQGETSSYSGDSLLVLHYGRIRVVTFPELHGVDLLAGTAMVELRQGDWGIDLSVLPENPLFFQVQRPRPTLQVMNFRGTARIIPQFPDIAEVLTGAISIGNLEWILLDIGPYYRILERRPVEQANCDFWRANNFQGTPPLPMPDTALPSFESPPPPEPIRQEVVVVERERRVEIPMNLDFAPQRRALKTKSSLLFLGALLSFTGAATEGIGLYYLYTNNIELAKALNSYGFIPLGLGIIIIVASAGINPLLPGN